MTSVEGAENSNDSKWSVININRLMLFTEDRSGNSLKSIRQALLNAHNKYRRKHGARALRLNSRVSSH